MKEPSTKDVLEKLENVTTIAEGMDYIKNNAESYSEKTFTDFFNKYLADHPDKNLPEIIDNSLIKREYAYEIINGSKNGSRDRIIALCFAAGMNRDEVNHGLTYSENKLLYAKNNRDATIILALNKREKKNTIYQTVLQLNDLLESNGYEALKTFGR